MGAPAATIIGAAGILGAHTVTQPPAIHISKGPKMQIRSSEMRKTGPQFPPAPTSGAENDSRETSAPGKQYQFSCVDRLPFPALRRFSSSRFRRPGYGRPANRPTGRAANRPSSQRANRPNSHFGWRNNADLKYRNVQNWAIIPPAPAKCAEGDSRKNSAPGTLYQFSCDW